VSTVDTDAAVPPEAGVVFGPAVDAAAEYARLLATEGTVRGLIGPREVPRLWDRHLLNSAAIASLVPAGVRVVDVGSGAGLPGIPLGLARPDLALTLVEPMARRVEFLEEVVAELAVPASLRWRVVRGRAEERSVATAVGPGCVCYFVFLELECKRGLLRYFLGFFWTILILA